MGRSLLFAAIPFLSYLCAFASLREIFFQLSGYLRPQFELPIFVREDVLIIKRMIKAVMRVHQFMPPIRDDSFLSHAIDLRDFHVPVLLVEFVNSQKLAGVGGV